MGATLTGEIGADAAVRFAFSDAAAGNISLAVGKPDPSARERLAGAVGADATDLVFMQQVHGADVQVVGADDRGRGLAAHVDGVPAVDALVTRDDGVALVVQVADCVPVLLADRDGAVAAVHAGRAGVVAGVVPAAVAAVASSPSARVEAVIGPAIGGCCYEVGAQVAHEVTDTLPAARATTSWGASSVDLPAAVAAQLRAAGVERVTRVGGCTRCTPRRWFSHRRAPGAGRQAGVIVRERRHAR